MPAAGKALLEPERGVAQLVLDERVFEEPAARLELHQPVKEDGGERPLIALDDEFGGEPGTLEADGTIVFDERAGRWVMFCLAFSSARGAPGRRRLYRLTSDDALQWRKGDDGRPQEVRIEPPPSGPIDLFSCILDQRDDRWPYKGWLYISTWTEPEGVWYLRSEDGRRWERVRRVVPFATRTIEQAGHRLVGAGDVTTIHADPHGGALASIKFFSPQPVGPGQYLRSRAYARVEEPGQPVDLEVLDGVALVPAADVRDGERPWDEYYASTAWRRGNLWLGGLKIWHEHGDYPHSAAGCAYLKLVASTDGTTWRRLELPVAGASRSDSGVFLPNGPEGGSAGRNDGGYVTEFSQGPIDAGEELLYYYGASSWGKNHDISRRVSGGGVFRARLRRDGFVSATRGTLETRPMRMQGAELTINGAGRLGIELLDAAGAPLSRAQVTGDGVALPVRFSGVSIGAAASGRDAVRLRFGIPEGARLYGFRIS